ncbi:MAG: helix-turn-helix domain-containing protein [Heteroscytonema crispum UTEX LB 1556]
MPAPLKIKLSPEEERRLLELSCADGVPRRTKLRAIALRLNAQGYNVREIAVYLDWAEKTVRQTIHRWSSLGLIGLWEASGRGRTRCWADEDWLAVEQWLTEERRYRQGQLSQRLQSEKTFNWVLNKYAEF